MQLKEGIEKLSESSPSSNILAEFLEIYLTPAFGTLPKSEIDLLVLSMLIKIGYLNSSPTVYDLVTKLRVTRTKAKNLIYQHELRKSGSHDLDQSMKELLMKPLVLKEGDLWLLEVENPLLIDHIKYKLKNLGYLADGSFSSSIIKVSLNAMSALIDSVMTTPEKAAARKALINAGAPDTSFQGILMALLKKMGSKFADEVGEKVGEKAVEQSFAILGPLLQGTIQTATAQVKALFT